MNMKVERLLSALAVVLVDERSDLLIKILEGLDHAHSNCFYRQF